MPTPPDAEKSRFRRLGRRIMGDDADGKPLRFDAREVLHAVLEGSDKAKSEVVRAVAREVRNYLEEMGLKDDIHNLLTNYSFEVRASVNLRRLDESEKGPMPGKNEPAPPSESTPEPSED